MRPNGHVQPAQHADPATKPVRFGRAGEQPGAAQTRGGVQLPVNASPFVQQHRYGGGERGMEPRA